MISIVLTTYTRADRLKLSIEDILNQTFKNFDLIICDNCSPDHTADICAFFQEKDNRVKYYRHAKNLGMPYNLNFGLQKAKYPFIAILHDGDRYKTNLLERWYKGMNASPNIGLVFNSMGDIDEKGNLVHHFMEFKEGIVPREKLLRDTYFRRWNLDSPVFGEAMIKKSMIDEFGLFDKKYEFYADVDFWMTLLHKYDAYYCAEILIERPLKTFQPRLFDDQQIRVFFIMYNTHKKHRLIEFKNDKWKLLKEMLIFYGYVIKKMFYTIALLAKHETVKSFLYSSKYILNQKSFLFLITIFWFPFRAYFQTKKRIYKGQIN